MTNGNQPVVDKQKLILLPMTLVIITLGKSLELRVVAEGIETPDQYQFFKDSGCHEIQGFLFSRPVLAEEAAAMYHQILEMKSQSVT